METRFKGNSEKRINMLQALEKNPGYICVLRQFDANPEFEN